jgi:hypothetical protein
MIVELSEKSAAPLLNSAEQFHKDLNKKLFGNQVGLRRIRLIVSA